MLKIYGSMQCPDCSRCREDLDRMGIAYEYLDFSVSLKYLKEFLVLRDSESQFEEVRKNGSIGIPCIIREDGTVTLSWNEFLSRG